MSQELELARARAKAKLKLRQQQMTHSSPVQEQPEVEEVEIPSGLEAGIRGVEQAVLMDFGDEVNAAVGTAVDYASGEEFQSLEDISNNYNKNLNESRENFALSEEFQPEATNIGTGIGVAASLALPGGAIAKGATAAAKAAKAAKIGAAYGAFGALGRSDDKMSLQAVVDTAEGAALGGVVGGAMVPVVGAVGKVGSLVEDYMPERMASNLMNKAFKGIGLRTEGQRVKFAEKLKAKGTDPISWVKRIAKEKDINGKPLIGNITESYKSVHNKVSLKIGEYGKQRDTILKQSNIKMDRKQIASRIKASLVSNGDVSPSEAAAINKMVDENVLFKTGIVKSKEQGDIIGMIPDETPVDALGLSEIRKTLDQVINFNSSTNANGIKKSIRNSLNDFTDDVIAGSVDEASAKTAKDLRGKMADLYSLQDSLEDGIKHVTFGDNHIIKETVAGARAGMVAGPLGEKAKEIAQISGIALRKISMSPSINRNVAFNANRLSESLPNVAESSVRRLVALADNGDPSKFNIEAAAIVAESDLKQSPILRTWDSVLQKKDSIMALANAKDPEIAEGLQQALDANDKDSALTILDNLSKNGELKSLFQSGIGFDGKVYTPEDKAVLEQQLKSTDIPAAQRIELLEDLRNNGNIPNMDQVVRPVPQPHVPRTKKVHDY